MITLSWARLPTFRGGNLDPDDDLLVGVAGRDQRALAPGRRGRQCPLAECLLRSIEAFQFYRVRVTDAGGVLIYDDDSVPIIGQAESGGGGPVPVPIDENGLAKTGDVKVRFDNAALAGWVRMNGRTIGKQCRHREGRSPIPSHSIRISGARPTRRSAR